MPAQSCAVQTIQGQTEDRTPRIAMSKLTPDMRIALSMEEIARYLGEISQMLGDLAARPNVDNDQLKKIATAAAEIERIVPVLLQR